MEVLCHEMERSRLWGGRMCWRPANASCASCGKPICPSHTRFVDGEHRACVTCEASERVQHES